MDCQGCKNLAPVGIKCNTHRTESPSSRLIRLANAAGYTLTGSHIEQALKAEKLLGARPVVVG